MVRRIGEFSVPSTLDNQGLAPNTLNPEASTPQESSFRAATPLHKAWHDGQCGYGGDITFGLHTATFRIGIQQKRLELLEAEASDEVYDQFETCANILEWQLFAEDRDELPKGLAYTHSSDGLKIVVADKELSWRLEDLKLELDKSHVASIPTDRLDELNKSEQFDDALKDRVREMPAYNNLRALCSVEEPRVQEHPLTKAQRQMAENAIHADLEKQGVTPADLHQAPQLRRRYQQALYNLDGATSHQTKKMPEDNEQQARGKVFSAICGQLKRMGYKDEYTARLRSEGPKEDRDYDTMRAALSSYIDPGSVAANNDTHQACSTFVEELVKGQKSLDELCNTWIYKVAGRLYAHITSVHSRPITQDGFAHIPVLFGDKMPKGPIIMSEPGPDYSTGYASASDGSTRPPKFLSVEEYADSKRERIGEVRGVRRQTHIPRLFLPASNLQEHLATGDTVDDEYVALRWKGIPPHLLGFELQTTHSNGEHIYHKGTSHDPYYLPPRESMLLNQRATRTALRDMGLDQMAQEVRGQRKGLTVYDLMNTVRFASDYYLPEADEQQAMQDALEQRDFRRLVVGGYLLSQCTIADTVLAEVLEANNYETFQLDGWMLPLTAGPISTTKHAQTGVVIDGKDYIFDATPDVIQPSAPAPLKRQRRIFAALRGLFSGDEQPQPEFGAGDRSKQLRAIVQQPEARAPEVPSEVQLQQAEATMDSMRQQKSVAVLIDLEAQVSALYGVQKPELLYKEIARRVPSTHRSNSPLWRTMSLARKVAAGQPMTAADAQRELQYIDAIAKADEFSLRPGQDMTGQVAGMLRSALKTLRDNLPQNA